MNFSSGNNNQKEAVNVNTRSIQFMNSEGFMPSTLLMGYWNDMISIKMHPALDASQQSDTRKFNYEEVVNTAITLEKAITLLTKIQEDVIPNYGKKALFRAIPVGGNSLIGVGLKTGDSPTSYLAIFKSLDDTTKKPEVSMYYEFKKGYTVNDYDPESGKFDIDGDIPGELLLFTEALRSAISGLTHAVSHSNRHVDKWFRDRLMNQLEEIGTKVGVAPKQRGGYSQSGGGGGYKPRDVFSQRSQPNTGGNEVTTDVSKLSNISDLSDFV